METGEKSLSLDTLFSERKGGENMEGTSKSDHRPESKDHSCQVETRLHYLPALHFDDHIGILKVKDLPQQQGLNPASWLLILSRHEFAVHTVKPA